MSLSFHRTTGLPCAPLLFWKPERARRDDVYRSFQCSSMVKLSFMILVISRMSILPFCIIPLSFATLYKGVIVFSEY